MSHKIPVIAGEDLVKYLAKQGFEIKRQPRATLSCRKNGGSFRFLFIAN